MTMSKVAIVVIDASLAVARLRLEEQTPYILDRFREWSRLGTRLVAPRAFWWEVVNVLAIRHRHTGAEVLEAVHTLETLRIESRDLDRGQLLLAISAVERHGLTAYDAQYLVLAETIGARLATLDRALARAAGSRAIELGVGGPSHRLSESTVLYEHDVTWPDYKDASAYLATLRAETARPS